VSIVDFDARMARYRRQNGRLTVTARQMRRAMKKFCSEAFHPRHALVPCVLSAGAIPPEGGAA